MCLLFVAASDRHILTSLAYCDCGVMCANGIYQYISVT